LLLAYLCVGAVGVVGAGGMPGAFGAQQGAVRDLVDDGGARMASAPTFPDSQFVRRFVAKPCTAVPGPPVKLSFVITYYNNRDAVQDLVKIWDALPEQLSVEFVVVDDGSRLRPLSAVAPCKRCTFVRVTHDIGWGNGGAKNIGAHVASGRWVAFIDVDHAAVTRDTATILAKDLWEGQTRFKFGALVLLSLMVIPRRHFTAAGGNDEDFDGLYGWEDVEMQERLQAVPGMPWPWHASAATVPWRGVFREGKSDDEDHAQKVAAAAVQKPILTYERWLRRNAGATKRRFVLRNEWEYICRPPGPTGRAAAGVRPQYPLTTATGVALRAVSRFFNGHVDRRCGGEDGAGHTTTVALDSAGMLHRYPRQRPILSFVIAYYNNRDAVQDLVKIWDALPEHLSVEFVVVDDGSRLRPLSAVAPCKRCTFVRVKHDIGWGVGGAKNIGSRVASGRWVAFIDADHASVTRDAATILANDLWQGLTRFKNMDGMLTGGDVILQRTAFIASGGFDERFSGAYGGEEREFVARVAQQWRASAVRIPTRDHPRHAPHSPAALPNEQLLSALSRGDLGHNAVNGRTDWETICSARHPPRWGTKRPFCRHGTQRGDALQPVAIYQPRHNGHTFIKLRCNATCYTRGSGWPLGCNPAQALRFQLSGVPACLARCSQQRNCGACLTTAGGTSALVCAVAQDHLVQGAGYEFDMVWVRDDHAHTLLCT
jgi:glycosyltransferase involved in cell wall biosynthesis